MPDRLVIRVKLPSRDAQPSAAASPRVSKGALLLIAGAVAVLLAVIAIVLLRTDSTPEPVVTQPPVPAPRAVAPVVQPQAVEPEVQKPPAVAPNSAINQVVPDVPLSARQTIKGTIQVSVRVIVARDGTVVAVTTVEPGPSRYFERLSLEAARKWTFTPATSDRQRTMMVRFYFKRSGTTARWSP